MTQTLLAIENLSVGFRHQQTVRTVVNDVSLQIEAGETLALVGESGSGKSVTALSILRLLPSPPVEYLSGDIRFHGESLLHVSDQTLRGVRGNKIAMIFQEPMVSLNPLHTLEKQLYEVLSLHRGMRREAARGEILNWYPPGGKTADRLSASALRRRTPAGDDCDGAVNATGIINCR